MAYAMCRCSFCRDDQVSLLPIRNVDSCTHVSKHLSESGALDFYGRTGMKPTASGANGELLLNSANKGAGEGSKQKHSTKGWL